MVVLCRSGQKTKTHIEQAPSIVGNPEHAPPAHQTAQVPTGQPSRHRGPLRSSSAPHPAASLLLACFSVGLPRPSSLCLLLPIPKPPVPAAASSRHRQAGQGRLALLLYRLHPAGSTLPLRRSVKCRPSPSPRQAPPAERPGPRRRPSPAPTCSNA